MERLEKGKDSESSVKGKGAVSVGHKPGSRGGNGTVRRLADGLEGAEDILLFLFYF